MTSWHIKRSQPGSVIRAAGLVIVKQRPPTAKGVTFATLEDEHGFMDIIIHREVYEKYHELFTYNSFLIIKGKIQRDGNTVSILTQSVEAVNKPNDGLEIKAQQYFY
jgi:error-prone DNA polymerase